MQLQGSIWKSAHSLLSLMPQEYTYSTSSVLVTRLWTTCVGLASIGIVAIAIVIAAIAYARPYSANLISVAMIATCPAVVRMILDICTFPAALNAAGILASGVLYTIFTRLTSCAGLASIGIVAIAIVIAAIAYARPFSADFICVATIATFSAVDSIGL